VYQRGAGLYVRFPHMSCRRTYSPLQVGRSRSSLPSKVKLATLALTASWISSTCCATTDSTCGSSNM
jgi:hypothetical protein